MAELSNLNKKFLEFINTRNHYFSNAKETIQKRELRKASELLWGSITQELKALAFSRNVVVYKHSQFRKLMRQISTELHDKTLYEDFLWLENLHRNFYDKEIDEQDFPLYFERVGKFIQKIDKLIEKFRR